MRRGGEGGEWEDGNIAKKKKRGERGDQRNRKKQDGQRGEEEKWAGFREGCLQYNSDKNQVAPYDHSLGHCSTQRSPAARRAFGLGTTRNKSGS